MLLEALKLLEGKEIDRLKSRLQGLSKSIKTTEAGKTREALQQEIELVKSKIKKLEKVMGESTEGNKGPNRSNIPSLQVLHVLDGMKEMLAEMKSHLQWERKEESKLMKRGAGSREHEKELLYYEQQIDLMEGMIKQLQAAISGIQQMEKDAGMVNESIKLIKTFKNDEKGTMTKVYHMTGSDDVGDPYMVKLFKNGKHYEPAEYFTDDKDDALSTAQHMLKESEHYVPVSTLVKDYPKWCREKGYEHSRVTFKKYVRAKGLNPNVEQKLEKALSLTESVNPEVASILHKCGTGDLEIYNVMNNPKTPAQKEAAKVLMRMYDEVASEYHLHPDDDFEKIEDRMADQLEKDYASVKESADNVVTHEVFVVNVPANIYDGKYYDFRTVPVKVKADSAEDAIKYVNANKKEVLANIDVMRMRSGSTTKRYVKAPVEKNVFFKDTYSTKKTTVTTVGTPKTKIFDATK